MSHARLIVAITADCADDIESAVQWQMMPFDENGECFRDGSRWDWYVIGGRFSGSFHGKNVIQVKNLNLDKMISEKRQKFIERWNQAAVDPDKQSRELIYGVDPDDTSLDDYLKEHLDGVKFPAPYAFLSGRHWHEGERMGWFGISTPTECEIKARENQNPSIDEMIRRCKYKDPESGACVVCWNEPQAIWSKEFYHRFIEPLSVDDYLVSVDYHV